MFEQLQLFSILLEVVIVVLSILSAMRKKKSLTYGFALTFTIYVFYDLAKLISINMPEGILYVMFFVATLSALYATLRIYKDP